MGGAMKDDELQAFRAEPHFESAIRLRRWDDRAKVPWLATPPLENIAVYLDRVLGAGA